MRKLALWLAMLSGMLCSEVSADQITMKNGDRLTGTIVKFDGEKLTIKSDFAGEVQIPWAAIGSRLEVRAPQQICELRIGTKTVPNGIHLSKVGQGFDFVPGSLTIPSHLEVPDDATLKPAQFTIEVWVKFVPEFGNYHVAMAKGFATGVNDSYALGTDGIANPQFFTTHNGSSHLLAAPTNLANANSWNHLYP